MAITAAGMVAAMVCPAFMPRYALAAPKTSARNSPSATARNVISGGSGTCLEAGIIRDGSMSRDHLNFIVAISMHPNNFRFPPVRPRATSLLLSSRKESSERPNQRQSPQADG